MTGDPLRHHGAHLDGGAFGDDRFGRSAEAFARWFGTPRFLIGQTAVVAAWIALNSVAVMQHWDPYPFILLNLVFSTQAAYAAPLILLAQNRQAERDKALAVSAARHRQEEADLARALQEELRALVACMHRSPLTGRCSCPPEATP